MAPVKELKFYGSDKRNEDHMNINQMTTIDKLKTLKAARKTYLESKEHLTNLLIDLNGKTLSSHLTLYAHCEETEKDLMLKLGEENYANSGD